MQTIGLLFKVLWSPGEAMFLLSKRPRVLVPLVFLCLFSVIAGNVMMSKLDAAELAIKTVQQSTHTPLTDQQKEVIRNQVNSPVMKAITFTSTVIGPLFLIALTAVLYFGLFTILGREGGFKAFFSLTAFAFMPIIFRQVSAVITAFVVPTSAIMPDELGSLSPAIFLDRDRMSPVLFAFVNTIDLVNIWILALLIIGYRFTTRKSLSGVTRAVAVVGVFLVYVALRLGLAVLRGV
jgi:Yip1 domain